MTKAELIDKLADHADITKTTARRVVDALFSIEARKGIIAIELDGGRKVTIPGFGTFATRRAKARQGRNPATGKTMDIPARTLPTFRAGKGLRDRVRE